MACLYLDKNFNVRISLWADEPKIPRKNRGTCGAHRPHFRAAKEISISWVAFLSKIFQKF